MQSVDPFGYKPQVMRQGSWLNQRDRHDQIVLIKSAQLVSHAQDSTSAALQRRLVDQVSNTFVNFLGGEAIFLISMGNSFPSRSRIRSISLASLSR